MIRPLEKLIAVESRAFKVMFIVALVWCAAAASAADWQWPTEMTVAGFKIMEIRGTTNNDGSGAASGKLMVPGAPGQKISLKRSSRGEITGSSSIKLRMSGAEVGGDFILNNSGLKGRGTAKFSPRSVEDCSMTISPDGLVKGTGKVALGNCAAAANFSVSKRDADLNGSTSARAQAEKPLADYSFKGSLVLGAESGRMTVTAEGKVVREGKLSGEVSEYSVSRVPVDAGNGRATVNVGGVEVTFDFF